MKINDKIVCIESTINDYGDGVVKGKIYTIYAIHICSRCKIITFDVGIYGEAGQDLCICGQHDGMTSIAWFDPEYFRPIEYNSATEELANKEIVKEVSDIPIKEPEKA